VYLRVQLWRQLREENIFCFCYNRSVDIGTLYIDGEKAFCLNDDGLAAVKKVMRGDVPGRN
jgi:hypothetical protein